MLARNLSCGLIILAVWTLILLGCSEEHVTNPTTLVTSQDTVYLVDTVMISQPLQGELLKFSAYQASIEFVKESYPERAGDRFSGMGIFCNYNAGTPSGRAGFKFVDNGDSTFVTAGYTYEYLFGAGGYVWGASEGQATERTYYYDCTIRLEADGSWVSEYISISERAYIRDTRHD